MHLYFYMHTDGKEQSLLQRPLFRKLSGPFSKIYISFFEERRLFQSLTEHNLVLAVSSLSGRLRIRYESWIARLFLKYRQWLAEIAAKTSTVVCDWSLRAVNNTSHDSLNIHDGCQWHIQTRDMWLTPVNHRPLTCDHRLVPWLAVIGG